MKKLIAVLLVLAGCSAREGNPCAPMPTGKTTSCQSVADLTLDKTTELVSGADVDGFEICSLHVAKDQDGQAGFAFIQGKGDGCASATELLPVIRPTYLSRYRWGFHRQSDTPLNSAPVQPGDRICMNKNGNIPLRVHIEYNVHHAQGQITGL